jgi:ferritin-like metal-binding protein YciE
MAGDIHEQLTKYLADAHSIEEQALAQLRVAPDIAGDEEIASAFRQHLRETEEHERLVRELLEERDARPSRLKDVVMRVGGKGFLLFARLQPDTPGKLAAHALSYEGLERASYELLRRTAERAGETEVAETAGRIGDDERRMMERLEGLFDRSVEASLRDVGRDDMLEQLRRYLADAHAIEEQAIELLERAPQIVERPALTNVFSDHLDETRDHAELIQERLDALGGDPSTLKDAALRLGALNWGAFFQGHPDTPGKLAAFAYAFEHLEIGGYEQLKRVAERAGDEETVRTVGRILEQERTAADRVWSVFDEALTASLEAVEVAT